MTMIAKFKGVCKSCGCTINVGEPINWTRGAGATHATFQACEAARNAKAIAQAAKPKTELAGLEPLVKFLQDAQARGLKFPKLRVLDYDNQTELRLTVTKTGSAPGTVVVKRNGEFIGSVRPDGEVRGALAHDFRRQELLQVVAEDPAKAAKDYAQVMCQCCFCAKPLTDAGSVQVGYGPICAKHWGLPHVAIGTPSVAPTPHRVFTGIVPPTAMELFNNCHED